MISRISGVLVSVGEQSALIENHGLSYEVLVPSGLAGRLKDRGQVGQPISFETIYYIEAGDMKSSHYPRLVGFTEPVEREFFSLFTQVSGLGVKKALKCLVLPIRDIAAAIETKDPATLSRLPGIGARLAEKIIAELNGKMAKFALSKIEEPLAIRERVTSPFLDEAVEVLVQLQYKRAEALEMVNHAVKANPGIQKVEDLITVVFRNEQKSQKAKVSS